MTSKMEEAWQETMTPKNLGLVEVERTPKPKPKPATSSWEEYNDANREAAVAKIRFWEEARHKGEDAEIPRREQRDFFATGKTQAGGEASEGASAGPTAST